MWTGANQPFPRTFIFAYPKLNPSSQFNTLWWGKLVFPNNRIRIFPFSAEKATPPPQNSFSWPGTQWDSPIPARKMFQTEARMKPKVSSNPGTSGSCSDCAPFMLSAKYSSTGKEGLNLPALCCGSTAFFFTRRCRGGINSSLLPQLLLFCQAVI